MNASSKPTSGASRLGRGVRSGALIEAAILVACVVGGGAALQVAWRSRRWPLIHDAPLMHYIAWLIDNGAVPYRDVFDMNLPGVYAIHLGMLRLLGPGDAAWRVFDLGWLAMTALLLWGYGRRLGGEAAGAAAAILFTLYHVAGGAWRAGQRDFFMCAPLLLGAWGLARSWERTGALAPLAWGGAAIGAAMTVKPSAAIVLVAGMIVAAAARRESPRSMIEGAVALLAGGLAAPTLVVTWLAWRGGLGAFIAALAEYVLPLYTRVARAPLADLLSPVQFRHGPALFATLAGLALLGLLAARRTRGAARAWLAVGGVGYGVIHHVGQGKGWEYHLYPFALFLCVLAGAALGGIAGVAWKLPPSRSMLLRRLAAVILFAAAVRTLHTKSIEVVNSPVIAGAERRVTVLTGQLAAIVPAGGRVQVMDTTGGGIHALFRLGIREPTRFIYDFHFFHHVDDPRILALRREFAAGLHAAPPAAVVIFRDDFVQGGYDRVDQLPGVASLLERGYTLAVEGDGYRIHAKRSGS